LEEIEVKRGGEYIVTADGWIKINWKLWSHI